MLDKKTRIGILAPITWSIPPKGYAPYERDVDLEIRGLLAAGYQNITLFATGQANYPGVKTVSIIDTPFGEVPIGDHHAWELMHVAHAIAYANEHCDVLHSHLQYEPITMRPFFKIPVVTTLHSNGLHENETTTFQQNRDLPYLSISNAVRQSQPDLNWIGTMYNGVDFDQFTPSSSHDDYLVFAGRILPEKGVAHAIKLAQATHTPLKLAGIVQLHAQQFFDEEIKHHLKDDHICYLGNLPPGEVHKLVSRAKAYVALNDNFPEPFGNSIAEAMASGTPVIATHGGSHDELITGGVTGILVDDVDEAIRRFAEIDLIDRQSCRKNVADLYSVKAITHQLLQALESILKTN